MHAGNIEGLNLEVPRAIRKQAQEKAGELGVAVRTVSDEIYVLDIQQFGKQRRKLELLWLLFLFGRQRHQSIELDDTNLGLEDADEYDTVGGLIYHRLGTVPKPGDVISVDGLTLTVETTDGRRVGKVLAVRDREDDGPEDDEADR